MNHNFCFLSLLTLDFNPTLVYKTSKYRVKRDLEENVAQDDNSTEDEIDCSSLDFLPVLDSQQVADDQGGC